MPNFTSEKIITVEYYAILREQRGCSTEIVKTKADRASDLYEYLKKKHLLSLDQEFLRVAINQEFQDWNHKINDRDTIVFLPPVAGG